MFFDPAKHEREEIKTATGFINVTKDKATGKELRRTYWSTNDDDQLKKAILTLIQNDVGFVVAIAGPAFKREGCLDHDSVLEIRYQWSIPDQNNFWTLTLDGTDQGKFLDPHEAVDKLFEMREALELGQDMADRGFSGHAGPSRETKARWAEEDKKPKPPKPPMPVFAPGDMVFHLGGHKGVVVHGEDVPKYFTPVWFGNAEEAKFIPSRQLVKIRVPNFHMGYSLLGDWS